jgi:PST family polysaccharide transporter
MFAEVMVVAIIQLIVLNKIGCKLGKLYISAERAKKLIRDSWPLIFASISIMIYMRIDQVMLGYMIDDHAVGIFSAAARLSEIWYFIPVVVAGSVFPTILRAKKNSQDLYKKYLQRLFDIMVWLSILVALPM